jgi:hypothetical protein
VPASRLSNAKLTNYESYRIYRGTGVDQLQSAAGDLAGVPTLPHYSRQRYRAYSECSPLKGLINNSPSRKKHVSAFPQQLNSSTERQGGFHQLILLKKARRLEAKDLRDIIIVGSDPRSLAVGASKRDAKANGTFQASISKDGGSPHNLYYNCIA